MLKALSSIVWFNLGAIAIFLSPATSQTLTSDQLNLPPELIENSPVIQKWSDEVPDVLDDIRHDPSFKTRWRLGLNAYPSNGDRLGLSLGVADLLLKPKFPLTIDIEGQTTFDGDRTQFATRANYYLLPLGNRLNVAPTLGYQIFSSEGYDREGLEIGGKIQLNLSRSGASTISLSQQFIQLGSDQELGITTVGVGYAFTENLRLATEIQKHNSTAAKESRVGIFMEFLP